MIIQNVCLSINKLCNDTLHFVFLFCIYYFQVGFHEIQFRHTFELNYGHINVNFCLYSIPNSRTDITKASCVNIGTSFIHMSVGCLLQANKCVTYCGEAPHSVQMSLCL